MLLNDGLWRRMFQGDRNVLGRVVKLDEEAYTVIGVLPRELYFRIEPTYGRRSRRIPAATMGTT